MSKRHHFIESSSTYTYERIIFCIHCGLVVFHFNDSTNRSWQANVGKECIEGKS